MPVVLARGRESAGRPGAYSAGGVQLVPNWFWRRRVVVRLLYLLLPSLRRHAGPGVAFGEALVVGGVGEQGLVPGAVVAAAVVVAGAGLAVVVAGAGLAVVVVAGAGLAVVVAGAGLAVAVVAGAGLAVVVGVKCNRLTGVV